MKKNYYLLAMLLVSSLTFFSACSDDDDNGGGGDTDETVKSVTLDATAYDKWMYFSFKDGKSVAHEIEPAAGTYKGDISLDVTGMGNMGTVSDLNLVITRLEGDSLTFVLDDFDFSQYKDIALKAGFNIASDTIGWTLTGGTVTAGNIVITPKGNVNGDSINLIITTRPGSMPMDLIVTYKGKLETRGGIDETSFDWDIALHRYDVKTNDGSALDTKETDITKVTTVPASGYVADVRTDSLMLNTNGMQLTKPKIGYTPGYWNEVLNKGIEFSSVPMPPVATNWSMSNMVYVIKLKSGEYAKIKFTDYSNDADVKGHISFDYVYPFK
ncbi:hypothetical protein NXY11_24530 [Parabacteroides faecis]|uniref:HmuY family protein n=1 Tax=Parabacteroides faecis TaxID=1217282 RepID=UPI002164D26E|nr:HmuY family protein [Parabacteroides faecis]MCS2890032.1 hypothetical protein [Parabacteroides faecis]UVQ46271.1 hypothetical protein NXY11_24530 [Parabacteroides faecis]